MKKILITGINGYIGKSLYNTLKDKYDITGISRDNFDLTNKESTDIFFSNRYFDVVIHTAVKGGNRLKQDNSDILDMNLKMYYNLLNNQSHFNKFIHLGSGAELYAQDTPYGLSKHVIRQSILDKNNFYNLRIFGIFDENELDTRFIKSNIKRYIKGEPIEIYENKTMDFFYMKDFINLIDICINTDIELKNINCVYFKKYKLSDIAIMINDLSYQKSEIKINKDIDKHYVGEYNLPKYELFGLNFGIKSVYKKLIDTSVVI